MARRRTRSFHREISADPVYDSIVVSKFINCMMWDGKRSVAERCFYGAIDYVTEKVASVEGVSNGYEAFIKALDKAKPTIEVKSRRVGGVTYQVPVEVYSARQQSLAIRWLLSAARDRSGKSMAQKLGSEIIDAYNSTGGAIKKKEEVKRMAEANRAFSHYAW